MNLEKIGFKYIGSYIFLQTEIREYINPMNKISFPTARYYLNPKDFLKLRNKLKMNQKKFSKYLGISQRTCNRIENLEPIGLNVIYKLNKIFGYSKINYSQKNITIKKEIKIPNHSRIHSRTFQND